MSTWPGRCGTATTSAPPTPAGRLTRDQVRLLLKVRSRDLEEAFDACEAILVGEVATCTLNAGRRFLARWVTEVRDRFGIPEPDGPDPSARGGRSRASVSPVGERWKGDLDLTGEDGEKVANAIDAQIDAFWQQGVFKDGDGLEPAERRAIALVEVIERGTRGGDEDGIARPLILGIMPMDHLTGTDAVGPDGGCSCGHTAIDDTSNRDTDPQQPSDDTAATATSDHDRTPSDDGDPTDGARPPAWPLPPSADAPSPDAPPGLAGLDPDDPLAGLDPLTPFPSAIASELSRSGPVAPEVLRRLACEGAVIPVYVGPGADRLNMGRTIRIANRTQRRNLQLRDSGCMFPGCSVPPEHCIAHHMVWWENGGVTDIRNLVLLCRYHHKAVHGGGFTIGRDPDGHIVTTRTDHQPITPHLRARTPLLPTRPPPAPTAIDDADTELDIGQVRYLTRCRLADDLRTAQLRRTATTSDRCRERTPSTTDTLRR